MKKPEFGWSMGLPFCAWLGLASALIQGCSLPPKEPPVYSEISPSPTHGTSAWGEATRSAAYAVGDLVSVIFVGVEPALQPHEERVKEDGTITLPVIGAIVVTNMTASDLKQELLTRYRPCFSRNWSLFIPPPEGVYSVRGEVRFPGLKQWVGDVTVTQAIELAGGFAERARITHVQLVRANGKKTRVDCRNALNHPESDPEVLLGDMIVVPRR